MFRFLKQKLKSFFSKEETPKKKAKKAKKEVKAKVEKPEKKKRTKEELKEERKITQEVLEDIKKQGLEIKTPEQRTEELAEEIAREEIEKEKKGFFSKLLSKFSFKISNQDFEEIFSELELILLENNVALQVVEKIKANLKKELLGKEIKKQELEKEIKTSLKNSIENLLLEPFNLIEKIKSKQGTFVILFFGINGSGKTTSIAKLAYLLKKNNISCVLTAADTFRAASIEQLEKHASNLGIEIIKSKYGSDPASVAFDAIKHASSRNIKAVLIDTAGRMHTKENLMKEMQKIEGVSKPDLKIFVAESITGNDATEQACKFNEAVGIDAIILSKADVDSRGGTILSVSYVTGKPILFLGVGQDYQDLQLFDRKKVIENLGL